MIIILIITFLLAFSQFISFLNGSISELSQEIYNRIITANPESKLTKIWERYDEICGTLIFIQAFTILLAVFLSGTMNIFPDVMNILPVLLSSITLILGIVVINFVFYSIGKRFCEHTLVSFATLVSALTAPLLPIINRVTNIFLKISGKGNPDARMEEITDLVEEARKDGAIDAGEYRILKSVMNFNDILVTDVMTPRIVLFSCKGSITVSEALNLPELQIFSRFPIWSGESIDDEVLGYVTTKEIFNAALNGKTEILLSELARPINFIPENAEIGNTLEELLLNKQQLYLVVDEYGGIEGIITMEDVIETILGVEIVDEADKIVDLRQLAKQKREQRINKNKILSND
ncbi:MAG: CBS domain-containing protein [Ignavibacteria bacterium]|jgi:CBS domain containing-hemolysin-like protein|nr:CBS domain-containing protein [Ignavibacteria bacterium]